MAEYEEKFIQLGKQNKGGHWERTKHNYEQSKREKAFSIEWRKENRRRTWLNFGYGILQDLFLHRTDNFFIYCELSITPKDRYIVATVIQWLGTNVGFCFLNNCMNKAGYKIVKINAKHKSEAPTDGREED